jgi:hypothetical protein
VKPRPAPVDIRGDCAFHRVAHCAILQKNHANRQIALDGAFSLSSCNTQGCAELGVCSERAKTLSIDKGETMRGFTRACFAVLLVTVLALPGLSVAEQIPMPVQKVILPGVTTVNYAAQTFVFTSAIKLTAKFEAAFPNEIRITIKTAPSHRSAALAPGGQALLRIYWLDGDEVLFEGDPPEDPWSDIILTEGGFTEK